MKDYVDSGAQVKPEVLRLRLDQLLGDLQGQLEQVMAARDRVHRLFEAVLQVSSGLELKETLRRVVQTAVTLVDAKYGALAVVDANRRLVEFIPEGLDEREIAAIDHWPEGHGLLGLLVRDPRPLRIDDMSSHPDAIGFPLGHPPMKAFIGAPVRVRNEIYGSLMLTEKRDGGAFDDEDETVLLALAAAAGTAVDNARLYEESRRKERWQQARAEVSQKLLSGAEPSEVLVLIAEHIRDLAAADLVTISLPPDAPEQPLIDIAVGDPMEAARSMALPHAAGVIRRMLETGEAITITDFVQDEHVRDMTREALPFGPVLFVPLGTIGDVRGVLTVGRKVGALPFAKQVIDEVVTFTDQAAVALQMAEHWRDSERISVYEDRDRIARDLHDLVIQRLFAIGMTLQGASRQIDDSEVSARVARSVDALDETIKEIRTTIFALQAHEDDLNDVAALRSRIVQTVEAATAQLGYSPSLRLGGPLELYVPQRVEGHLLAVLREALSNVVRHAQATKTEVSVEVDKDLLLIVADNGKGIKPGTRLGGLRHMADRAQELGGELITGFGPEGKGTVLRWRVPLDDVPTGRG